MCMTHTIFKGNDSKCNKTDVTVHNVSELLFRLYQTTAPAKCTALTNRSEINNAKTSPLTEKMAL